MEMPPPSDDTGVDTDPADAPPDLRRFFAPSSVALVGATTDTSKFGGRCFRQLRHFGYRGRIYPVNPGRADIDGLRCYPSLADLPEPPDHVGIVVPGEAAITALRQAAALGAPFATIFTAGFAETGTERGCALQAEIRRVARETGIRVMGPNCNGLINFVDCFALTSTATISGPRAPAGDVGLASHSGGLGQVSVMWRAQQAGIPISYEVSCGNDSDLDLLDYAGFMVDDPHTRIVLLLAERISNGAKLTSLARRARQRDKPLLILKLGRTEDGSRVAASHTGAVTGADAVHDAAFRQFGMIRVDDCAELYQTASLLRGRRPRGHRVGAMSLSGGHTVLIADIGAAAGLQWPAYTPETQRRLAELLPAFGHVGNPTDVTAVATGQPGLFRDVLETLIADPNIDAMVPIITFARRAEIEEIATIARTAPKPVAVLWTGTCSDDDALSPRVFTDDRTPVFRDATPLLRALRRAADYVAFRPPPSVTRPAGIDPAAARAALGTGTPTERQAKRVLACYGLPVVPEHLARSAEAAARIAAELGGKLALKIESPDIAHKTEVGGVRLDVAPEEAAVAFAAVMAACRVRAPSARLDGVLVQPMARPGTEIILGATHDPVFGAVVTVGIGGVHVELLHDVVHRIAPIGPEETAAMLRELRLSRLLDGVRGEPPRDTPALCDAVWRFSLLAADLIADFAEIDVNPLILHAVGEGATIVDALIVRPRA